MLAPLAVAAAIAGAGAGIPQAPGQCGVIRGRLDLWNGGTPVQIWVVGTRRMLGVEEPIPGEVTRLLDQADDRWAISVFGEYRVCAVTRSRPGHRQSVTIVGTDRLEVRPRP
ncbi:hypothetical protein [Phenylobacterium sp.]|uniref:hypothetical protein n=1 Tax=Phenylobacterium sp. TaxID=1871053 RepID=UPI002ED7DE1B